MKFPKFRNTNRIPKILFLLIVIIALNNAANAQTLPNIPVNTLPATTVPATTGTKEKQATNNRTTAVNRTPVNAPTDTRNITLAPADQEAMEQEEQTRLQREADLAKDLAKTKTIKRTFGSSIFSNTKFDPSANVNVATPSNYVLGPGDKLNLDLYGYSQWKQTVTINSDGYVVLEKAGVVSISGLNIDEAERKIKSALSKIYLGLNGGNGFPANTFLKLSLTGYRSIKIKITGEVVAPGTYTVTSFTSMLNALYACGGPNEIGTYREIKLIRNNRAISTLDLYDFITKGFSKGDMLLKDQDIIQVGPFVSRIAIEGNMKRTGLFEVLPQENLNQALAYAGGFDQYAYSDRIKIYRNTSTERKIMDVKSSQFNSTLVQSGDSIVVGKILERFENLVTITGAIFRPGEYSLDNNKTLTELIKSAEGLKEESLQGRINIIRTNEDLSVQNISVNLADIKSGKVSDIELKRLDQIFIPSIFELTEVSFVKIQGAINNPEALNGVQIPYVKNMTIQDLIVKVGGLTEAASLSKVEVVRRKRNVDPKQIDAQISEIIEFEIQPDLVVDKKETFYLLPFDEVFIRTSPNYEKQNFVTLKGEVIFPGKYGIKYKDEKISDLINRAGGLSPQSYIKGATLVRKSLLSDYEKNQRDEVLNNLNLNTKIKAATQKTPDDTEEIITEEDATLDNQIIESVGIDLQKILQNPGSGEDLILQDGDIINIPKRLQTVRIEGEVLYPTTVKFLPDLKFIDYVSRSGGFTKKSARSRAFIIYPNGSVDRTRKFLFVRIHPKVEPGSEIVVPGKTENTAAQFTQLSGIITSLSFTITTIVSILTVLKLNGN